VEKSREYRSQRESDLEEWGEAGIGEPIAGKMTRAWKDVRLTMDNEDNEDTVDIHQLTAGGDSDKTVRSDRVPVSNVSKKPEEWEDAGFGGILIFIL